MPYHSALQKDCNNMQQLATAPASIHSNTMHSFVIRRSPSIVGPVLVVLSLFVLVLPFIPLLHFTDVNNNQITSSMIMSKSMLPSFPQIVASCLVMYISVCLNYVGRKLIEEVNESRVK